MLSYLFTYTYARIAFYITQILGLDLCSSFRYTLHDLSIR